MPLSEPVDLPGPTDLRRHRDPPESRNLPGGDCAARYRAPVESASLGYRTSLALLRAGGSVVEDRGDHLVVRTPSNPEFWWGNFLLLERVPSPAACDGWLARFETAFPGAGHVAIGFDGPTALEAPEEDLSWFEDHGCAVTADVVLTASALAETGRRNETATYRPLRSDDDWAASIDLRLRCRDEGLDPEDYHRFAAARAQEHRRLVAQGHGEWFGAFVDETLVSQMGLFRTEPGLARFQSVETDPAFRRRGLASSLLHHAGAWGLASLGVATLVIVADPEYHAIALYRKAGFVDAARQFGVELHRAGGPAAGC